MERPLRETNFTVSQRIRALRRDIADEFGWLSRIARKLIGPVRLWSTRREKKRLARVVTYEPKRIIERRNWA
jgi:hypothetical protein